MFNKSAKPPSDEPAPPPAEPFHTGPACCCPGRPVVTVLVPPSRGRPHVTDLLLCAHHFRVSRGALRAAGATAYDRAGTIVLGRGADQALSWDLGSARREGRVSPAHPAGSAYR